MTYTQQEKLIINIARNLPKEWNKAHELIGNGATFIGYEVTARLSELEQDYPEMIEGRREGKYRTRRLRVELAREWLPSLPESVKEIVKKELLRTNEPLNLNEL